MNEASGRYHPFLHPTMVVLCATIVGSAGAPSGPMERMTPASADEAVIAHRHGFDPERFEAYDVIEAGLDHYRAHGGGIRDGNRGAKSRSGLTGAVVMEADTRSERVIPMRRAEDASWEELQTP